MSEWHQNAFKKTLIEEILNPQMDVTELIHFITYDQTRERKWRRYSACSMGKETVKLHVCKLCTVAIRNKVNWIMSFKVCTLLNQLMECVSMHTTQRKFCSVSYDYATYGPRRIHAVPLRVAFHRLCQRLSFNTQCCVAKERISGHYEYCTIQLMQEMNCSLMGPQWQSDPNIDP